MMHLKINVQSSIHNIGQYGMFLLYHNVVLIDLEEIFIIGIYKKCPFISTEPW